jgi:hypothetical protein
MLLRPQPVENYCHLLNITKAILNVATNIDYNKKIPCNYINKNEFCNNINELFLNTYIEPTSHNMKFINVLQKSITNTLQCDNIIHSNVSNNNYFFILKLLFLLVSMYIIIKKCKIKFH